MSTAIIAEAGDCPTGECSDPNNHAEGIVVATPLTAGGSQLNHAEGIILPTA